MTSVFDALPVELVADILGELDLSSLVTVSYLSRRLYAIASDPGVNPWRVPILRNLHRPPNTEYETSLKHLSVRQVVPRQNWIEILSLARAEWLLFQATLPNLKASDWEECFKRRFLPGWEKWKKESGWKEAFLMMLHRIHHRSHSSCTSDESWTKYIMLNRNGSANLLEASSRNYNPLTLFHEFKLQNNLAHLETHVRQVVEFADVRIIALGVLHKPRSSMMVNKNARLFLHPPGMERVEVDKPNRETDAASFVSAQSSVSSHDSPDSSITRIYDLNQTYRRLMHPLPAKSHANYPFYTPSGEDKRWLGFGSDGEEGGRQWVGGLMLTAQLIGPHTKEPIADGPWLQDLDLVTGRGRSQYGSFTWPDLAAIAPWLELTKRIDGPGLGI
ncbi:hypothetical protein ABKN59_007062 [Abortiporus biennis]